MFLCVRYANYLKTVTKIVQIEVSYNYSFMKLHFVISSQFCFT